MALNIRDIIVRDIVRKDVIVPVVDYIFRRKMKQVPRVVCVMKYRMGNQIHQLWVVALLSKILNRPLHIIYKYAHGCNILENGLFELSLENCSWEVYNGEAGGDVDIDMDPIEILFQKVRDSFPIDEYDIVIDNSCFESWPLISKYDSFIRSLYVVKNPFTFKHRIAIHVRLGDTAHANMCTSFDNFVLHTINDIQEDIPICIITEEPNHHFIHKIVTQITNLFDRNVHVICNENCVDDFKELACSSHIIATNSTFSFWAGFLSDQQKTKVHIAVSGNQPAVQRNKKLFESGSPGNFKITNIDNLCPYKFAARSLNVDVSQIDFHIFTITTSKYCHMTHNLIRSIKKVNANMNVLVVCCDDESFNECSSYDCHAIRAKCGIRFDELMLYASDNFNIIMHLKIKIIHDIVKTSRNNAIIYCDSDIVFMKDPEPLFAFGNNECDIAFQCDEGHMGACSCSNNNCACVCAGFMKICINERTRSFFSFVSAFHVQGFDDQVCINACKKNIKYLTFPRFLVPNGVFVNTIPAEAIVLHYNYMVGYDKISSMKKNNHWFVCC